MGRKRTGNIRQRGDGWYVSFRLPKDDPYAPSRQWERRVPPPVDGGAEDETYARACLAKALREFENGTWHPFAPKEEPVTLDPSQTVYQYASRWIAGQAYESAPKNKAHIENYLARSALGGMRLVDVNPQHVAAFISWLKTQPAMRGTQHQGTLAPRSIRNIYDAVRRAFTFARFQKLIPTSPCELPKGILPTIEDKDETARDGWEFTHQEIGDFIWDPRVPEPRRVYNALCFLTGMRPGEVVVLRWRDWDRTVEPLTRLSVVRARKSVSGVEGKTKTGARKIAPVLPALEEILSAWHDHGWERFLGRAPTHDDFIIPNKNGARRSIGRANRDFGRDTRKLGIREGRHQYVMRHAFITRVQDDGADGTVMKWVTHAPPRSAHDGYSRALWFRLCAEISKLRITKIGWQKSRQANQEPAKAVDIVEENGVGARGFEPRTTPPGPTNTQGFPRDSSEPVGDGGIIQTHRLALPTLLRLNLIYPRFYHCPHCRKPAGRPGLRSSQASGALPKQARP